MRDVSDNARLEDKRPRGWSHGTPQFPSLQARSSVGVSLLTGDTSGADENSFETTHAASGLGWCSSECRAYVGPDNIPSSIDSRMIIIRSERELGLRR